MFRKQAIKMLSANGRTSACVNLWVNGSVAVTSKFQIYLQNHAVLLDEENPLDSNGSVRVDNVVGRFQMSYQ